MWIFLILLAFIIFIACSSIKIVKQAEVYVIERLGRFYKVADAGLTIIIPFFDHVRSVVSLKQQTMDAVSYTHLDVYKRQYIFLLILLYILDFVSYCLLLLLVLFLYFLVLS